jgi:hypothetical protein
MVPPTQSIPLLWRVSSGNLNSVTTNNQQQWLNLGHNFQRYQFIWHKKTCNYSHATLSQIIPHETINVCYFVMFLLHILAPVGHLQGGNLQKNSFIMLPTIHTYIYTHTHIYIYIYIYEVKIQCHQSHHLWLHVQSVRLNTIQLTLWRQRIFLNLCTPCI